MNLDKSIMSRCIALILGGGAGTRLYPLTKERSKPAVPIAGKYRLIDIPISNCLNAGLKRMFVLTQFNSASLNRHIKNTFHFDTFSNAYVDILAAEQTRGNMNWFQGTADAVRQSVRNITASDYDHVVILSGDQLYQMDFEVLAKYHQAQNADVTIGTIPVVAKDATAFGIMKVNKHGFIERFTEKPGLDILPEWTSEVAPHLKDQGKDYLASMGIYIFKRKVLRDLLNDYPDATDFGKEIIPESLKSGLNIASFAYDGYWTDIGDIRSFFEANIELTQPLPDFNLFSKAQRVYTRSRQLPPAKISGTQIDNAIIAEGGIIHAKKISNSIIGIRSRIGTGTVIDRCYVIGNDYFQTLDEIKGEENPMGIGANCNIKNAIVDKHVHIGDNVSIIGDDSLADEETDAYSIRKGIIVLNKYAVIPPGTVIGKAK